ncbi:MAG: hypothetical protein LUD72_01935, partial [Bacteroidales bacterium]|nr:hypothetical protein [Bacteroidales bacterium]
KEAEKFCREDPEFKAAFFGYKDKNETDEKAAASMMLKIAAKDDDTSACEYIFRASAWGENVPEKTIKHLAHESVNLVCAIREKIADFQNGETLKKFAGDMEK